MYIGRHKKKMILSLLFSAISAACSLLGPMLIQRAIDVSVPQKAVSYTHLDVYKRQVQEMVDLISHAFDTADTYRMPAMILADGMLGQMMEPVVFKEKEEKKEIDKSWARCV